VPLLKSWGVLTNSPCIVFTRDLAGNYGYQQSMHRTLPWQWALLRDSRTTSREQCPVRGKHYDPQWILVDTIVVQWALLACGGRNWIYSYGNTADLLGQRKGNGNKRGNAKRCNEKTVDYAVIKLLGVKGVKILANTCDSEDTYPRSRKVAKSTRNPNTEYHIFGNLRCIV
jgi:hypothetical protein